MLSALYSLQSFSDRDFYFVEPAPLRYRQHLPRHTCHRKDRCRRVSHHTVAESLLLHASEKGLLKLVLVFPGRISFSELEAILPVESFVLFASGNQTPRLALSTS